MKKSSVLIILPFIFIALLTGCKKDNGEPPVLPPAGSMTIDFSNFQTQAKSNLSVAVPKGILTTNWQYAAGVAMIWDAIITTTLAVPVASFQVAVKQTPTYIGDKTWQWSYNVAVLSVTYNFRLTGQINASDVAWKMYISKTGTGGFNEFVWFSGTSSLDGTSGQWILNKSYDSQVPVLQIDWTKSGTSIATIKYSYVESGSSFAGSYIEYGLTSDTLNAYYTIHYYSTATLQFYDVNVKWDTTSHEGEVQSELYFGDDNWYCWDSNYLNVTCS